MNRSIGFLTLVLVLVVGCTSGDKPPAYANVSGTVNYNGKPIEKGKITFATDGRPPSTTDIIDGKFTGQAMIGSNKVVISAMRKMTGAKKLRPQAEAMVKGYSEKMKGEVGGFPIDYDPDAEDYIPPEWGQASTQIRVIEAGGATNLAFEIKGK